MTIQANIQALQDAYDEVIQHPMCRAIHDDGCMIRVLYPAGFQLDGIQCAYGVRNSKTQAYRKILDWMERHWKESQL